jgi:hypothetical protein
VLTGVVAVTLVNIVFVSEASNHIFNPGMFCGEKAVTDFVMDDDTGIQLNIGRLSFSGLLT